MHKFAKKVYMSMLTVAIVCITMFATTYAWVGMLANSTFDSFNIGLDVSKLSEYQVDISLSGEKDTFGSSINIIDLKRSILKNMGYNTSYFSDKNVEEVFSSVKLDQVTTKRKKKYVDAEYVNSADFELFVDEKGNQGYFFDGDDLVSNKLFKFDLYVSVKKSFEDADLATDYNLDIYLKGDLFSSKKNQSAMINDYQYPSDFVNNVPNGLQPLDKITGNVGVKPENACRIAIQKHKTVRKYYPNDYKDNDESTDLVIFEGGSDMPINDPEKGYSFGGILPTKYNLAVSDWNKMYPDKKKDVPEWALNRGDIEYNYKKLNQIVSKDDGVSTETMVKLSIYFWFEGWDADCFKVIDNNPVDLNFMFTTNDKEE